jgi:hypothetical protein
MKAAWVSARGLPLCLCPQQPALDGLALRRQPPVRRVQQEGIDAALCLHGADGAGREPHPDRRAEDVGQQRRDLQVGQETAAGLVVGVADVVARQHALAGYLAAARHRRNPVERPA